jgi:transcriptional regulator with XRE-family HTH domain
MSTELPDSRNQSIAYRLKRVRLVHELTQLEFTSILGVSARSYKNYELGDRELPISLAASVCAAFSIDANWLLLGIGPMHVFEELTDEIPAIEIPIDAKPPVITKDYDEAFAKHIEHENSNLEEEQKLNQIAERAAKIAEKQLEQKIKNKWRERRKPPTNK